MPNSPSSLSIRGLGEEIASLSHLPWSIPLEDWPEDPSLALQRGISRHVVRLVRAPLEEAGSESSPELEIYAVKETIPEIAEREYEDGKECEGT